MKMVVTLSLLLEMRRGTPPKKSDLIASLKKNIGVSHMGCKYDV